MTSPSPLNPDPSPPVFRLNNVYIACPKTEKVVATIDQNVYNYFFRHLLAGPKGPVQAIIAKFFEKLHHHYTEVLKVPAVWDEDAKQQMAYVLSNLNFREPVAEPTPRRRATASPSVPQAEPTPSNSNTRAVKRAGKKATPTGGKSE